VLLKYCCDWGALAGICAARGYCCVDRRLL